MKVSTGSLSGVVPIIPTPFTEAEEIDEQALCNLIDFAVDGGIETVCLPAYASEFYKLTDEEKLYVVKVAVDHAAGRIKIVAQSNNPSLRGAIKLARENVKAGADVVSLAVPRIFSLPEDSLKEYLGEFLQSIPDTPVLIQDFNPGGASISVNFIEALMNEHPNFKYLKLEEPLCAPKFEEIIKRTKGNIGLFEGWGGLYMLELIPLGIAGAPTATVPMLRLDQAGGLEVIAARWGLIPFWWKSAKPPKNTFNARSEEAATKPMWRSAY